jgi:glycosyltransferase involved in cell wall biosynthesis
LSSDRGSTAPKLSVVVVTYDMAREFPRTLRSLAPGYQRDIKMSDYEVIVVDNGSPDPVADAALAAFPGNLRFLRCADAPPSPARAANTGIATARAELIGLIIDGARLASPGLLAESQRAARHSDRPIIATLGWHLGAETHMDAAASYDRDVEDRLLTDLEWEVDGYRLFAVSTFAGSSARGWFGPLGESSALFMPRPLWQELGGLDEAFAMPGGGLVNHDLYRRACALPDTDLVVLLGEGTFHQMHGGAATSRRFSRDAMFADYAAIRGHAYQPPEKMPRFSGQIRPACLPHLERSIQWALRHGRTSFV